MKKILSLIAGFIVATTAQAQVPDSIMIGTNKYALVLLPITTTAPKQAAAPTTQTNVTLTLTLAEVIQLAKALQLQSGGGSVATATATATSGANTNATATGTTEDQDIYWPRHSRPTKNAAPVELVSARDQDGLPVFARVTTTASVSGERWALDRMDMQALLTGTARGIQQFPNTPAPSTLATYRPQVWNPNYANP